jgi:hypothetical protein
MSLGKTWYRVEKAVDKFGISAEQIGEWIEEGLIRSEPSDDGETMVNADDLLLQVEGLVSEVHDSGDHPETTL